MYETSNLALSTTSETNDGYTDKKNHKCDVCSKLFRFKSSLLRHKIMHTNAKNHKCDVCSKLFRSKSNLLQHKLIHTNEKNHKCDVCSKLFRRKFTLLDHKKIHTNEKSQKCDVCSKLFRCKSGLLRHKIIHEKKSYQCFECGKNLTCRNGMIKHVQRHTKFHFKCDKCQKVFISAVQLKNHYVVHIEEKLFSCNLCAESFVEKRKLKSHIFINHIHNDTERDVILQPYNNSVSLREAKSECCNESGMKSCSVVLERFQTENNGVYDMVGINSSETADSVPVMKVKAELEESPSSESKPFNVSIIYNEEDVEESKPFNLSIIYNEEDVEDKTNGCVISSAIDEIKQENCIVKLENYDDV